MQKLYFLWNKYFLMIKQHVFISFSPLSIHCIYLMSMVKNAKEITCVKLKQWINNQTKQLPFTMLKIQ